MLRKCRDKLLSQKAALEASSARAPLVPLAPTNLTHTAALYGSIALARKEKEALVETVAALEGMLTKTIAQCAELIDERNALYLEVDAVKSLDFGGPVSSGRPLPWTVALPASSALFAASWVAGTTSVPHLVVVSSMSF